MKKTSRVLMLLAAAAVAFSCEKETSTTEEVIVPEENVEILTINADAVAAEGETKTALSGTTPSWAKDDQVSVVYTKTDASVATQTSSKLAAAGSTASFSVALTSPDAGVDAYAYYPANELAATASTAKVVINDEQFPVGTSFDGDSDILVSDAFTPSGTVDAHFRRLGAVLRIKLSNAKINSEKLLNLSVTAANPLAGTVSVRLSDGVATGIESGSNTVTATYASGDQFALNADGKYVYLIVYPQTLASGSSLTFSGETENATFTKNINLSKDIVLSAGHIKPLSVAILDENITPKDKVFFEERFSAAEGTMGWSGTGIASGAFKADNTWKTSNSYGAGGSARFGTSSKQGVATTSSISISPVLYQSQDIKLSFRAGAWNGGSESTELTVSSTNCTLKQSGSAITSVDITKGDWTSFVLDVTGITDAITITFQGKESSNSRFLLDDVCVYYGTKPIEKTSPELAFSTDSKTGVIGDTFTKPTLTNTHGVSVRYESSEPDYADVDSDGNITLKAPGTTTISAIFDGNASYLAQTVTYSLTVENPTLTVSETTPAKGGISANSTVVFTITSANIGWSASKGTDADEIIKSVTTDGNTVTVTLNENTESREKTATVNVQTTNRSLSAYDRAVTITQYAKVSYTITWVANGVTFTTTSAYSGPTLVLPGSNPTKSGYAFRGWTLADSVNSDGTGITYAANGDVVSGATTYYAVFAESNIETNYTNETLNGSDVSFAKTSGYCTTTASTDSGDWSGTTCYNTSNYIQINKHAKNYYIGSPTFGGDIVSVTVNTTNNTANGRTFYLCSNTTTAQPTSGDLGQGSISEANGSVVITAEDGTTQFYLYSNGVAYISSIVVRFEDGTTTVYSNYTI